MIRLRHKIGAGILAASSALVGLSTPVHTAAADPLLSRAFVGVGSDTTQDIFNAFSGASPFNAPANTGGTKASTPLFSSPTTGNRPIASWDAQDPLGTTCIIPKLGAGQIDRPNGSGDGQKALSRAETGTRFDKNLGCSPATATNNVAGQIDFSRSSSGPNASFPGTTLTFIPFARDGLGYAFVDKNGNGTFAGGVTTDELRAGFGTGDSASPTGTFTHNGEVVRVCGLQSASGTLSSWDKAMGNSAPFRGGANSITNASAANSGCGSAYEEHNGNGWFASPFITNLAANENAIIPFSAAQWIAQANGAASDRTGTARAAGVDMGGVIVCPCTPGTDLGKPYTGTGSALAPNAVYFANSTFGRDMYVVVPTAKVPAIGGDAALKSLFRGTTSAICSANAQSIDTTFGFAFPPSVACGTTGVASLQSGYVS